MEASAELVRHKAVKGRACTPEELAGMLKGAYPVGNRAAHGKEALETDFIGTLQEGGRLYDLYQDQEGFCWYGVRVATPSGIVSEFEALFGYPEKEEERRRREWREGKKEK